MAKEIHEPDRIQGAPHPRDTPRLIGQDAARTAFLEGFYAGRLHHAWLITGPRGVGKATLAWTIARFLLATPEPQTGGMSGVPDASALSIPFDHPVARRMRAGAQAGLVCVTRSVNEKTEKLRDQIVVDDIRRLNRFFQLSASDGGRRVVIIDAADDMNIQAANALLKILEEPPERATLLLVSHQPSRLLPTIRSRCRTLRLGTLDGTQMQEVMAQAQVEGGAQAPALAALSGGSAGEAIRLALLEGLSLYAEMIGLLGSLPRMDRARALRLAEAVAQRGAEEKLDLLFTLLEVALARLARTGATGQPPAIQAAPQEAAIMSRLSPDPQAGRIWAEMAQEALSRAHQGRAVNLDPAALVLDTMFKIQNTSVSVCRPT